MPKVIYIVCSVLLLVACGGGGANNEANEANEANEVNEVNEANEVLLEFNSRLLGIWYRCFEVDPDIPNPTTEPVRTYRGEFHHFYYTDFTTTIFSEPNHQRLSQYRSTSESNTCSNPINNVYFGLYDPFSDTSVYELDSEILTDEGTLAKLITTKLAGGSDGPAYIINIINDQLFLSDASTNVFDYSQPLNKLPEHLYPEYLFDDN